MQVMNHHIIGLGDSVLSDCPDDQWLRKSILWSLASREGDRDERPPGRIDA